VPRLATVVPTATQVAGHEQVSAETTDQKVRGSNPFGRTQG
jgi:hypothetical protein